MSTIIYVLSDFSDLIVLLIAELHDFLQPTLATMSSSLHMTLVPELLSDIICFVMSHPQFQSRVATGP